MNPFLLVGLAFIAVGLFGALLRVLDAADTVAEAKWIARHHMRNYHE